MAVFFFCIAVAASIHAADEPVPSWTPHPKATSTPNSVSDATPAIFKTYRETGMAKSFAHPRPENTVEDYTTRNHFYHAPSNTYFEMIRRGADYFQLRYQIGYEGKRTNIEETKIDYFLGSGIHARAYLHRSADGRLLQLPVTWYSEKGGYWWMAPGYDSPDHIYGQRAITYDCIFCHNGYEAIPATHARLGDEPVYSGELPEGVDCQRCHGPGQNHIQAASKPGAKPEDGPRGDRKSGETRARSRSRSLPAMPSADHRVLSAARGQALRSRRFLLPARPAARRFRARLRLRPRNGARQLVPECQHGFAAPHVAMFPEEQRSAEMHHLPRPA